MSYAKTVLVNPRMFKHSKGGNAFLDRTVLASAT